MDKTKVTEHEQITICTNTLYAKWYNGKVLQDQRIIDKTRGDLALKMIRKTINSKLKIIIVDGGSSQEFINRLKDLNVFLLNDTGGTMSSSRRKGYTAASRIPDTQVIAWLEPEKYPLINKSLIVAAQIILSGKADIVIPSRKKSAFTSLPPLQSHTEQEGNKQIKQILQSNLHKSIPNLDMFFGPKLFANRADIIGIFTTRYDKLLNIAIDQINLFEKWSNTLTLPVVYAILKGYRVISKTVDYTHPKEQSKLETKNLRFNQKRIMQLEEQTNSTKLLVQSISS